MELDRPLTADETRRLAETWKKRYSTEPTSMSSEPGVAGVSQPAPNVAAATDEEGKVCVAVFDF